MSTRTLPPMTEAAISQLKTSPNYTPHPQRPPNGTVKAISFQASNGAALTVDKNSGNTLAVFALQRQFPSHVLPHIHRKVYPWQPGPNRGYNSAVNVHQYNGQALVRLFPRDLTELADIAAVVAS